MPVVVPPMLVLAFSMASSVVLARPRAAAPTPSPTLSAVSSTERARMRARVRLRAQTRPPALPPLLSRPRRPLLLLRLPQSGASGDDGLVTSTVTTTATYTITSCAASVPNCPKSHTQKVVTSTVIVKTTVCPATATATASHSGNVTVLYPTGRPTNSSTHAFPTPYGGWNHHHGRGLPLADYHHLHPPTNCPTPPPTVIIEDTTTVCPATESAGASSAPASSTQSPPKTTASGRPLGIS